MKNLLNMTSGYADYVYQPSLQKDYYGDPFQQWTNEQLIDIGVSAPMLFDGDQLGLLPHQLRARRGPGEDHGQAPWPM